MAISITAYINRNEIVHMSPPVDGEWFGSVGIQHNELEDGSLIVLLNYLDRPNGVLQNFGGRGLAVGDTIRIVVRLTEEPATMVECDFPQRGVDASVVVRRTSDGTYQPICRMANGNERVIDNNTEFVFVYCA